MFKTMIHHSKIGLVTSIALTLLTPYANASSFGLQTSTDISSFPASFQVDLDTTDRSSVGFGLGFFGSVSANSKYFWNTNNHSGLFTEASVSALWFGPSVSAYLQQGYRWLLDDHTELDLKGGLGIMATQNVYMGSQYEAGWSAGLLPTIGLKVGFRF
jgi:hypothetical protein